MVVCFCGLVVVAFVCFDGGCLVLSVVWLSRWSIYGSDGGDGLVMAEVVWWWLWFGDDSGLVVVAVV
jgi:hypothetical protein